MSKKIKFFIWTTFGYLLTANLVFAQNIWKGARCGATTQIVNGGPTGPCDLCDAMIVTQNIITLMLEVAIALAVAMIVFGAILLMVAAGNESRVAQGKKTMTSAFWGLIIALSAWIIVNTVLLLITGVFNFPWTKLQC